MNNYTRYVLGFAAGAILMGAANALQPREIRLEIVKPIEARINVEDLRMEALDVSE